MLSPRNCQTRASRDRPRWYVLLGHQHFVGLALLKWSLKFSFRHGKTPDIVLWELIRYNPNPIELWYFNSIGFGSSWIWTSTYFGCNKIGLCWIKGNGPMWGTDRRQLGSTHVCLQASSTHVRRRLHPRNVWACLQASSILHQQPPHSGGLEF